MVGPKVPTTAGPKTRKIVVNRCWGGFGLSHRGAMRYAEIRGITLYPWLDNITTEIYKDRAVVGNEELTHHYLTIPVDRFPRDSHGWPVGYPKEAYWYDHDLPRDDPALVQVVEELGAAADGPNARLAVVEIPADVKWVIDDYDGRETVEEEHRSW